MVELLFFVVVDIGLSPMLVLYSQLFGQGLSCLEIKGFQKSLSVALVRLQYRFWMKYLDLDCLSV